MRTSRFSIENSLQLTPFNLFPLFLQFPFTLFLIPYNHTMTVGDNVDSILLTYVSTYKMKFVEYVHSYRKWVFLLQNTPIHEWQMVF